MLNELLKVAECRNFFKLVKLKERSFNVSVSQCGFCMKQNIVNEWLRAVYLKSGENFKVLVKNEYDKLEQIDVICLSKSTKQSVPYGLIEVTRKKFAANPGREHEGYFQPGEATEMKLRVAVDCADAMQFFLQWQRYRKIWWSSITTSPGLFHLRDITYNERSTAVEVMASFPWGIQPVESISIQEQENRDAKNSPSKVEFQSTLTVECALLTLFADGYLNRTKEGYLRLHRTMAPYKVSFAIDCKDLEKNTTLRELAELMNYKLNVNGISTWLPDDSSAPMEQQILARYQLGVPYTVVLSPDALDTGILQLLNSSTTLKEQFHISDFNDYMLKLLKSCFIT